MSALKLIKCLGRADVISPNYLNSEPFLTEFFLESCESENFLQRYSDYYKGLVAGDHSMEAMHSYDIRSDIFPSVKRYGIFISNEKTKHIEIRVNKLFLSRANKKQILLAFAHIRPSGWFIDIENFGGNERVFLGDLANFDLFARVEKKNESFPSSICFKTQEDVENFHWKEWVLEK